MFRAWSLDDDYIVGAGNIYAADPSTCIHIKYTGETPPYTAPAMVYTSARVMADSDVGLEWLFPVDSGFHYLLRLHFCEYTTLCVAAPNQRVFSVSINFKMMESAADDIHWAGGPDIPVFRDYITWVPDDGRRGKQHMRLSVFPYLEGSPKIHSALLNGLEIFKLSDSNRSLAAANPELEADSQLPPPVVLGTSTPLRKNKSRGSATVVYAFIGSVAGALAVVAAIIFLILRRRGKNLKDSAAATTVTKSSRASTSTVRPCLSLPSDLCRYVTIDEIKSATRNFDDSFIIGKGGFGNVYRGLIDTTTTTTVAIKRLNPSSNQGAREFPTEIEMLSKLRHLHLVSLIGYCDDGDEMILLQDIRTTTVFASLISF